MSSQYKASVKAFEAKGTSFKGETQTNAEWRGSRHATEERSATLYANTYRKQQKEGGVKKHRVVCLVLV